MQDHIQRVHRDDVDPKILQVYRIASAVALVGNGLLFVIKAVVASTTQSSAIYADAANSASDVAYSLLMVVGLYLALQPADIGHPHGHRRIEPLISLAIGLLMGFAAYEAARSGVETWLAEGAMVIAGWALLAPISAIVVKATMYVVVSKLGQTAQSLVLTASARDHLTDIGASVVVLLGVAGSQIGFVASDPIAAFLVSIWIFWSAFQVLRESVKQLIGGAPADDLTEAVLDAIRSVPEVIDVHQVIIEYVGPQVRADIHVNLPGDRDLYESHRIGDAVQKVVEELPQVDHAFVHVEPVGSHD